jgi:formyltetrahydrofolate deformylase
VRDSSRRTARSEISTEIHRNPSETERGLCLGDQPQQGSLKPCSTRIFTPGALGPEILKASPSGSFPHPLPIHNNFGIGGSRLFPSCWCPVKRNVATITVIGRDKTGVVARVTNFLFQKKANIEALEEQVTRGQFSMTLQASWKTAELRAEDVQAGLAELARQLGMEITFRYTPPGRRQRIAIMVTRESHCLEALLAAWKSGKLKCDPAVVIGNRPDLEPIARRYRLPFLHIPWEERAEAESAALQAIREHDADLIVLARFMKILSPNFVWRHKNKIINIHPSLLPSFPGPQAYRQAYEHGVKIIGATAHFVSMHLDEGPIIAQGSFQVRPGMSLKEIVAAGQKIEASLLVKAVKLYLTRQLDVFWGVVKQV